MLMYSNVNTCFEHSNFFTVNDADRAAPTTQCQNDKPTNTALPKEHLKSNYELFNCNNVSIH